MVAGSVVVLGNVASAAGTPPTIRIAAGATASWSDPSGRLWSRDMYNNQGSVYSGGGAIAGTSADPVYRRHRWGMTGYAVPVECAATYRVTLHFAETALSARGKRVFDVSIEGATKLAKLDVFAAAGGKFRAHQRTFDVLVPDKTVNIGFRAIVEDPMISGLEVRRLTECKPAPTPTSAAPTTPSTTPKSPAPSPPTSATPPPVTPTTPAPSFMKRVNVASTSSYTDSSGAVWAPDSGFTGGASWQGTAVDVANTTSDTLYHKHRWGMTGYRVAVPQSGTYRVTLHFAELVFSEAGRRVFDVTAEGATKLDDLDVYVAAGGANRALTRTFDVAVSDGTLDLGFSSTADDAMLSGIQVSNSSAAATPTATAGPTVTATPTVAATPTVPVTPTATATPTVTPTPTVPSTGFPNASNTGVPAGTVLQASGPITVTQAGTVITNKLVSGDIIVLANNVTIKNSKIVGGRVAAGYGQEQSGLVVTDVEFDGAGRLPGLSAIGDVNYKCIRCNIHGTGNGPRAGANVVVEDSYIHDLCCYSSGDHRTGFGSNGGSNITLRHNYIECDIGGCSAAASFYNQWTTDNVLIEGNKFNTLGNYCLYAGSDGVTNFRVINNVFGQKFSAQCGSSGPFASRASGSPWSGNKFEDGRPIN